MFPPPPEKSRCAQRHLRNAIGAPARSGGGGGRGPSPAARSPAPWPAQASPPKPPARRNARAAPAYGVAKGPSLLSRYLGGRATRRRKLAPTRPRAAGRAPISRRFVRPSPALGHSDGFSENVRSFPHRPQNWLINEASERLFLSPSPLGYDIRIAHLFPSRPTELEARFCLAAV